MKQSILTAGIVLSGIVLHAQNVDVLFAGQQTIELKISTPQPRLNETFQISLDVNHLKSNIFRSLAGKVQPAESTGNSNEGEMIMSVTPTKKGKNEIGPLSFLLDKTIYNTNRITYEVVDALPDTDRGLWFRKVITSDSTFCIIIEQRIPAKEIKTTNPNNSFTVTTEPEYKEITRFRENYSVAGLSSPNAQTSTSYSSVKISGVDKQFMYGYSVYYFTIVDKNLKIKITRDKFENIPPGFKFEDIPVQ